MESIPRIPHTITRLKERMSSPVSFPLGLGESGVHEVCEQTHGDMPALTGFALAASMARRGPVFWISQAGLGRDHGRILQTGLSSLQNTRMPIPTAYPRKLNEALWTVEEAIKSAAVGLIIAEIEDTDFTASRRLALASGRHGVPVILLMPYTREGATAASARWRVAAQPSSPNPFDAHAPGRPRWHSVLERSRRAPHMAGQGFNLELNDETLSLTVVPGLAAHTPAPGKTGSQDRHPTPAQQQAS